MRQSPMTIGMLTKGKIGQVVFNIFTSGEGFARHNPDYLSTLPISKNQYNQRDRNLNHQVSAQ